MLIDAAKGLETTDAKVGLKSAFECDRPSIFTLSTNLNRPGRTLELLDETELGQTYG